MAYINGIIMCEARKFALYYSRTVNYPSGISTAVNCTRLCDVECARKMKDEEVIARVDSVIARNKVSHGDKSL